MNNLKLLFPFLAVYFLVFWGPLLISVFSVNPMGAPKPLCFGVVLYSLCLMLYLDLLLRYLFKKHPEIYS